MPKRMKRAPTMITNHTRPPLKKIHAACLKFQNSPHHEGENQAIIIAAFTRIRPIRSSTHLFIVM